MSSKKDNISITKRPIICVNLDYYDAPDEALLEELYNCVLEELADKNAILSISLYQRFNYDGLMLVVFCKNVRDVVDCSLLDYIKGDGQDGFGGG